MAKGQQHKLDDFGDKKVSYVPEKKKRQATLWNSTSF